MAAVTVANPVYSVIDNRRVTEVDVTFSASYATGGDTVSPAALGLSEVDEVSQNSHKLGSKGTVVNTAALVQSGKSVGLAGTAKAPTIKLFTAQGTEATNASDNHLVVVRVRFFGS